MFRNLAKLIVPVLFVVAIVGTANSAKAGNYLYNGHVYGFGGESFVINAMSHIDLALISPHHHIEKVQGHLAIQDLTIAHNRFCSFNAQSQLRVAIRHLKLFCFTCNPADLQCAYDACILALKLERIHCGIPVYRAPVRALYHAPIYRPVCGPLGCH